MGILNKGECMFDKGGSNKFGVYSPDSYRPTSVLDGIEYVKRKLIADEFPEMSYADLSIKERMAMDSFMTTVCHDTVNDWKRLHNV